MKHFRAFPVLFFVSVGIIVWQNVEAQLSFEPNIVNGVIQFEETVVGENSQQAISFIGQQQNDAQYTVQVTVDGVGSACQFSDRTSTARHSRIRIFAAGRRRL